MTAHDEYGASSAKRWTSCLRSVALCAQVPPSQDSEWGDEGRAAHAVLEVCLGAGIRKVRLEGADEVNAAGDVPLTPEMARAVQVALDYIYKILDANPGATLSVENRVKVPSFAVPGRMGGTLDVRIYLPQWKWLHIIDYKHGAGIFVSEEDNLQMDMYAIASLFEIGEPVERVTTTIIQPRSFQAMGAIRQAERPIVDLLNRWAWFDERAELTKDPNAPLAPDPDNCRWCTAGGYGICPVAERTLLAMFDPNAKSMREMKLPDGKVLSPEQASYVLANEKLVTALLKNIRMTWTGFVKNGGDFPGWKLVLGDASRAWHGDHATIAATLMQWLGKSIDEVYPRQLIGVTEAENLIVDYYRNAVTREDGETKKSFTVRQNEASKLAREALAMLTLKEPRGQPRLVPLSDVRTALETSVPHLAGQINLDGLS